MSLKTLITAAALLVGSSTAALAEPYFSSPAARGGVTVSVRDHRAPLDVDGAWMRNHRRHVVRPARAQVNWYASASYSAQPTYWNEPVYQPPVYQPAYQQPSLVSIQPATALVGGQLKLGVDDGRMAGTHTLQIKSAGEGGTYVDSVQLLYLNHQSQTIPVNRSVDPNNPCIDIPLGDGSGVSLVIINGTYQGGAISVDAL